MKLWDAPVRIVHWALLILIGFCCWSFENHQMEWHLYSGHLVLALVVFCIYWGFAGAGAAQFAHAEGLTARVRMLRRLALSSAITWMWAGAAMAADPPPTPADVAVFKETARTSTARAARACRSIRPVIIDRASRTATDLAQGRGRRWRPDRRSLL